MKYSKILLLILLAALLGFRFYTEWQIQEGTENVSANWEEVLRYAQEHLPLEGRIVRKSDGFVYLKVDDRYIRQLFPMLNLPRGYREPPYFRSPEAPGAHITLFYADEHVYPKKELGQIVHFTIKDIRQVQANRHTHYVILQVDAPELEEIRRKYGFRPKIGGKDYHISIAKKETGR